MANIIVNSASKLMYKQIWHKLILYKTELILDNDTSSSVKTAWQFKQHQQFSFFYIYYFISREIQ